MLKIFYSLFILFALCFNVNAEDFLKDNPPPSIPPIDFTGYFLTIFFFQNS
jgi:hypothetical protein